MISEYSKNGSLFSLVRFPFSINLGFALEKAKKPLHASSMDGNQMMKNDRRLQLDTIELGEKALLTQ